MENVNSKLKKLWADERPFKKRMFIGGSAALAFCFMFIFFGPFEMVAFGSDSFLYSYKDIFIPLALTAVAVFIPLALILFLLRGKIFDCAVCAVFILTVCGYMQAAFMNASFGTLTGDAINWNEHTTSFVLNVIFWLAVTALVFFIMYLSKAFWSKLVTFVSLLLVIMQLVPTFAILAGLYEQTVLTDLSSYTLSKEGMYEFSSEDNVIIIVLDRLDYDYIEKVLEEDPDFFDRLDGFTSYTNAISAYARTRPALAQLLTGYRGKAYTAPATEYFDAAWKNGNGNILTAAYENGMSAEFYTSIKNVFGSPEYVQYVSNAKYIEDKQIIYPALLEKLMNLSVYRYAPTAFKPFFWTDTNYYNNGVFAADERTYVFSDSEYAPGFKSATAERDSGSLKLYHFFGTHNPYYMNADGTESEKQTSVTAQAMGCFNILYSMFDRMKELGIYKDAAIIITGDHGAPIDDYNPLTKATRIGLFYKPSGSEGTPLVQSKAQVCTDNIPATVLKSMGADYSEYALPLDEIGEDDQIERIYYKSLASEVTNRESKLYKYRVTGDASDFSNWEVVSVIDIKSGNWFN